MNKTKIVATLGPSSNSPDKIRALAKAGASIFRLNFSHGSAKDFVEIIKSIRDIERELRIPLIFLAPRFVLGRSARTAYTCSRA